MKKRYSLLALLMSVVMITSAATGCGKEIETSVAETTITTTEKTTTKATTKATTTTAAETTTTATTTATTKAATKVTNKAATTTAKAAAATTAKPATAATAAATTAATTAAPAATGVGKYVYNTLTADEKTLYTEILNAVNAHQASVTLSKSYDGATVTKIYEDVYFQEPTLFWWNASGTDFTGTVTSIPFSYSYDAATTAAMQGNLNTAVANIQAQFPAGCSAVTKIKVIHDYIVARTTSGWNNQEKATAHGVAYNIHANNAYGPLVAGFGQCEGYAKAVAYVCDKLGIENVRITGTDMKDNTHAWNKVQINGQWYNVDTTWDDPVGHGTNYYKNNYLLVPDSQIVNISHKVVCSFAPPAANSLDANYFVQYGLCAGTDAQAISMMQSQMIAASKAKLEVAQIKCNSRAVYDAIKGTVIGQAITMMNTTNATAGCNPVKSISDGSDPNTWVIQINLAY